MTSSNAKQRCPICKAETVHESRPFCSKRCKDIDLSRWLGDGYAIAGGNGDADEDGDDGNAGRDAKRDPTSDFET
jgi:uncharacterized protein